MRFVQWNALVMATLFAGCSTAPVEQAKPEPQPEQPMPEPKQPEPEPMQPEPEPEKWVMPSLIGNEAVLEDENPDPNIVEVRLRAEYATIDLGFGAERSQEMWTYNGMYPGPVLQAEVGQEIVIHFENHLASDTTVHWHGLRISDEMDGSPRIQKPVVQNGTFTYRFKLPDAGTYWYHPHVRTNEQMERGLVGTIVVHDRKDPVYDAERVIVLDDILLDPDTYQIVGPFQGRGEAVHGRSGNVLLTNGRLSPDSSGTARPGQVERWRIVNTANARTMDISLRGASFRVIGTDGGLLRVPYVERGRLEMPVGQRFDLEVTYDGTGPVVLESHVLTLNKDGTAVIEVPVNVFDVTVSGEPVDTREIVWPDLNVSTSTIVDHSVVMEFDAVNDPVRGLKWRINGQAHRREPLFTFNQGEVVRMTIRNLVGQEHPFHLHGQFFTIRGRPGFYDTVLLHGGETIEIVAAMDNPGMWMAHCHILEHAELGMMSEILVNPR